MAGVLIGETVIIETIVTGKDEARSRIFFVRITCTRSDNVVAIEGDAELFFFRTGRSRSQCPLLPAILLCASLSRRTI